MLLLQFISKLLKPQSWKFGFGTIAPRYKLCWCCWSCIELNYRNQINSLYRGATSYNYGAETSSGAGDWDRPHSLSGLISHYQISGHRFQSNLSHQPSDPCERWGARDLSSCKCWGFVITLTGLWLPSIWILHQWFRFSGLDHLIEVSHHSSISINGNV